MRCMECYMRSSHHLTVVQSIFVSAAPFIVAVILMILLHIHRSGFMSLMYTTVLSLRQIKPFATKHNESTMEGHKTTKIKESADIVASTHKSLKSLA
ncbi:uncharacterized protein F5891DRAFT_1168616 [Suillus fuscotomentosus]|uniref:Uncharacterized protein n=1 Tax=Suillus fuscotomentosus TaxID=1912939 RepID=A0AAD4HVY8_9AGAM|nr:uncharacterized protein F5891DRAFT_1168616 [Suillus fuscotomentosus]KAG1908444.1 hypothetical protein F5891DRAFT_1168616 [Suillus fuscotomentosus]